MNNKKLLLSILFSPLIFSNQCEDIELFFNAPMDGFKTNAKEFKVEFGSKNIQITPAGIEVEDRQSCIVGGHHHLIINNAYDVDKNIMEPIPYGANILHFGGGQTEAVLSLSPGKYTLELAAGDPLTVVQPDILADPLDSYVPFVIKFLGRRKTLS